MEFKHPNLVCESFSSMTFGMDSFLYYIRGYHYITVISCMTSLKGDVAMCEFQAGSQSLEKISSLFASSFPLTLHQPELPVPQPRLQQMLLGTLQSEKDSETIFLLRLRDFFPLLFTTHKNMLLKGEREKNRHEKC